MRSVFEDRFARLTYAFGSMPEAGRLRPVNKLDRTARKNCQDQDTASGYRDDGGVKGKN